MPSLPMFNECFLVSSEFVFASRCEINPKRIIETAMATLGEKHSRYLCWLRYAYLRMFDEYFLDF